MLNIINFWNILVVIYAVLEKSQYYLPWCFLWYHILKKIKKIMIILFNQHNSYIALAAHANGD